MTASPLIIPVARFFTISGGAGLAGGKVYTYAAGTNTPKVTYTDYTGSVMSQNTNPVILDSSGSANIWLIGNYKINLLDSNDVQQANYPVDNVSSFSASNDFYVTTGTVNNYILTPAPSLLQYTAGDTFNVQFNIANSGPATINVSNLGAKSLVFPPSTALNSGNLLTSIIYTIVYDGTNFQVLNPTTIATVAPILIQMGFQSIPPTGYLSLNGDTIAKTSGGTFNGTQYTTLFAYLWNNCTDTVAPVSAGRGVSAAADFAANKNITLPDRRDYSPFGVSIAGSITAAGAIAGATTVVSTGTIGTTVNAITLSTANLPVISPTIKIHTGNANSATLNTALAFGQAGGSGTNLGDSNAPDLSNTLVNSFGSGTSFTPIAASTYTGNATSILHKVFGVYWYINY